MKPKGSFILLIFLLVNSRFFLGLVSGVPVKDRDVWSSSLEEKMEGSRNLEVRFNGSAKHWTDALPIGNGRLDAMIWGVVVNDTINLNEDTLWTGIPGNYTDSDAPNTLSQVRKLVDDGRYADATLTAVNLSGNPSEVYQVLGDIKLEFDLSHASYNQETYQRVLDLDTATVKIQYSANEILYTREHFASNPDQVIVMKIFGNKTSCLNFTVSVDSQMCHHSYVNDQKQIIMDGSCPGTRTPPQGSNSDSPKGIQYSAVLDLETSGGVGQLQVVNGRKLRVEGCDWAVLRLTASSSFGGPFIKPEDPKKDPGLMSLNSMDLAKRYSYDDLYECHARDYQELFHRVSLKLSKSSNNSSGNDTDVRGSKDEVVTTGQRVMFFKNDEDPSLVELMFQYGRYLLIACSRPGTQASNLQGIWNKDVSPPWDGAPHLNINLQMNYWPSLSCNLNECQEPLFDYIESLHKWESNCKGELWNKRLGCTSSI